MVGRAILAPPHIHCRPGMAWHSWFQLHARHHHHHLSHAPPPKMNPSKLFQRKVTSQTPFARFLHAVLLCSAGFSHPHPFFWSVSSSRGWGHMSPIFHLVACFRIFSRVFRFVSKIFVDCDFPFIFGSLFLGLYRPRFSPGVFSRKASCNFW